MTEAKTTHPKLEGPAIEEPTPIQPTVPIADHMQPGPLPRFPSDLEFQMRAGKPAEGGSLKLAQESLFETYSQIRQADDIHRGNLKLSAADRQIQSAETANQLLQAALKRTDRALGRARDQLEEITRHLKRKYLAPSKDAREELRFQAIWQGLEGKPERFTRGFAAARSGDGETVRALDSAPAWFWESEGDLHRNSRATIRRAYLLKVAPEELGEADQLQAGSERVIATATLLTDVVFEAIDFRAVELTQESDQAAQRVSQAARRTLRAARLEGVN